jgi:hypothetical protein
MSLQLTVDNIEIVPEAFRGEYAEKDGKFHLNVLGLDDTSGLKSALQKERDANKKIKAFGRTDSEIAAIIAEREALQHLPSDFAATRAAAEKANTAKFANLETELKIARDSERKAIVDACVHECLARANATAEGFDLLSDRLATRVVLTTENGKRKIQIMQPDGKPMTGTGANGAATFADLARVARDEFPSLFVGTGAGGGGKNPRSPSPG